MYKRAIEADPKKANNLGNYANFLTDVRGDHEAAEVMYKRAIEADPKNANNYGNFVRFLLARGRVQEGRASFAKALASLGPGVDLPVLAECWMYQFCCGGEHERSDALKELKSITLDPKSHTGNWSFEGVIAQARKMHHQEIAWLPKLAEVVAGRAPANSLASWPAWRDA